MADFISKWTAEEIDENLGKGLKAATISHTTSGIDIILVVKDGNEITVRIPYAGSSSVASTAKNGLIRGTELATLNSLSALEDYITKLIELAQNGGSGESSGISEAYKFIGVVSGVTIQTSSTTANSGFVLWDKVNNYFVLRVGLTSYTYYRSWAKGTATDSSETWNARLVDGNRFYVDNGDGTMLWYYYDGSQMLEAVSGDNLELGTGLAKDSNGRVGVNLGSVFTTSNNVVGLNIDTGLTTTNGVLGLNIGSGLTTETGYLTLSLRDSLGNFGGLCIDSKALCIKLGTNPSIGSGIVGFGLKVDTDATDGSKGSLKVNIGQGLGFDDLQERLEVKIGAGLAFDASSLKMKDEFLELPDKVSTLEDKAMRTIIEVAGVDYTTTTAPTNSIATNGLPLYWLALPAVFAVKSGTTYYTMPSTDERFAVCGLRRTGQLFKCGGETFYLDENLNPVFVNSSVRFDRSGTSVKVYPSNSTLRSLYEAAGAVWNENTGYYELNGVNDIDEEEMQNIFVKSNNVRLGGNAYYKYPHRTIIRPIACSQSENLISLFASSSIVSAPEPTSIYFAQTPNLYDFASATSLRIIGQTKSFLSVKSFGTSPFFGAKELVHIRLMMANSNQSIPMKDCVRISYYTLNYMASNWTPTAAVTVTLPTAQAQVLNAIIGQGAEAVTELTVDELNSISGILAQMPWEAKLKITYSQPIWREDNGSTIAFTNRFFVLDDAGEEYTFRDASFSDARPSLIKHETGANGEYIYASWQEYVADKLATDQTKAGSELAQYTTAENATFATSIHDWIILANKFVAKGITIADGGAAATSEEE